MVAKHHSASENPIGIETWGALAVSTVFCDHSASENPIGIETMGRVITATSVSVSQRIRKPDRD